MEQLMLINPSGDTTNPPKPTLRIDLQRVILGRPRRRYWLNFEAFLALILAIFEQQTITL